MEVLRGIQDLGVDKLATCFSKKTKRLIQKNVHKEVYMDNE